MCLTALEGARCQIQNKGLNMVLTVVILKFKLLKAVSGRLGVYTYKHNLDTECHYTCDERLVAFLNVSAHTHIQHFNQTAKQNCAWRPHLMVPSELWHDLLVQVHVLHLYITMSQCNGYLQ